MATLTQLSSLTKKFMPVVLIGFAFFLFFFLIIRSLISTQPRQSSEPQPRTSTTFGKLPALKPTPIFEYPPNASFIIDNIEGRPITAASEAPVFFLPKKTTKFGYLQTIYLMAKTLNFNTDSVKHTLKDTTATFDDGSKKLNIDITNFNFDYKLEFENRPELFEQGSLPSEIQIVDRSKQFLRILNRYPTELAKGKTEVFYLNYDFTTAEFTKVDSPEFANAVEVNFFRPDVGENIIVSPTYYHSQNYVVMIFQDEEYMVLKAQVHFFEKDEQTEAVYPLKNGQQAFDALVRGDGFIISTGRNSSQIIIRKMLLGYYDLEKYQEYLQPVYIFLGDNGFVAYVQAVSDDFIQ